MGTHEIAVFPDVAIFDYPYFKIQENLFLHYVFTMLWNIDGNVTDSNILLCLHIRSEQKYFHTGYWHIPFEYHHRVLAFIQTDIIIQVRTLYAFIVLSGMYSFNLLSVVYLSSSGCKNL